MSKTIINHPQITINRWYKPSPNRWFIVALPFPQKNHGPFLPGWKSLLASSGDRVSPWRASGQMIRMTKTERANLGMILHDSPNPVHKIHRAWSPTVRSRHKTTHDTHDLQETCPKALRYINVAYVKQNIKHDTGFWKIACQDMPR